MDRLWAPWRLAYVLQAKDQGSDAGACFICRDLDDPGGEDNLLVWRGELCCCILNRFPYNNGHLLIAPNRHVGDIHELTPAELLACMETMRRMMKALDGLLEPQGNNVGLNLGRVAGAGLPGHLHWHVVPRWNGDTNFMPVLADIKVLVQSLDDLYRRLREALEQDPCP